MKKVALMILGLLLCAQSWAAAQPDFQGFVQLPNQQKIYAIHYQAQAGEPTLVFLHGLTYTTKPWEKMVADLAGKHFGILVYDPRGMGKTLEETGPAKDVIAIETQAEDLLELLDHFNIAQADLAGLSYGGALGMVFTVAHPDRVRNLIVMSPYVKPLKQQDDMIKQKVKMHHWIYPSDKRSDDELYDYYLREIINQTYPMYEPVVKDHPWRLEAIWRMVQGVRKWLAVDAAPKLPNGKVHFMVAGKDQYVPKADHDELWNALSKNQKMSRIDIAGSEHKIPEAVPHFAAAWIEKIVLGEKRIADGREYQGDPAQGKATSKDITIELPKDTVPPRFGFPGMGF